MPASRMTCLPQTTLARWPHSASVGSSGLRGTFLDGACVRWWSQGHPQDMLGGVFPLFRRTSRRGLRCGLAFWAGLFHRAFDDLIHLLCWGRTIPSQHPDPGEAQSVSLPCSTGDSHRPDGVVIGLRPSWFGPRADSGSASDYNTVRGTDQFNIGLEALLGSCGIPFSWDDAENGPE